MITAYINTQGELLVLENDKLLYNMVINPDADGYDVERNDSTSKQRIATFYKIKDARTYLEQCRLDIEKINKNSDISMVPANEGQFMVSQIGAAIETLCKSVSTNFRNFSKEFNAITNPNQK